MTRAREERQWTSQFRRQFRHGTFHAAGTAHLQVTLALFVKCPIDRIS